MPRDPDPGHDPTLAADDNATPTLQNTGAAPSGETARAALAGYRVRERIGVGGMGEVVVAHQDRIGRDVAVKRMHATTAQEAGARFLREARIQARLEHPAIVPVYDIGEDADGQPFFAMKRLAGTTLAEVMRAEPPASSQRLLRAFADVCLAVEFAHSRGVVHRDLKPANIVLGHFGEVYVLDWGLARVIGDREVAPIGGDIASIEGLTVAGTTLGTPGYMAPEQVEEASAAGPEADIYSLGSVLFELLAKEPLHVRGGQAMLATMAGVDGSPAHRRPDLGIAPELDALCIAALAMEPEARPTARVLAERVQQYLDGDRDVARRKGLAAEHLATANAALATGDASRRADAMRAAGRALALDPESREVAQLVTRLMLEPPRELPAELSAEITASEHAMQRRQSRVAVGLFGTVILFLLAAGWNGVLDWRLYGACIAMTAVMAAVAVHMALRSPGARTMLLAVVGNSILVAMITRGFSSLILVPGVSAIMASSLVAYPQLVDHARKVIAILAAAWLVPVVLETTGVLSSTWTISAGSMTETSKMFVIDPATTTPLLVGGHLALIVVTGVFATAIAKSRRQALRTAEIQAWHLRQLLPA